MTPADTARLVALAAIWGAAFIFMRVAAPVLGPAWTPELRVLIGGLALLAWFRAIRFDPGLRVHWRFYLLIGTVNIAIPFVLYSFASMHAPASLLSITNATSPIFGLAWAALFGDERVTLRKATGLGGRDRRTGDTSERARSAVTWRIRHAIRKLEAVHPALARHLRASIKTGAFCSYEPEKETHWFV